MPKDNAHIVLVSQKVKDIKLPPSDALESEMGQLRRGLRKRAYIAGDKVPADLKPQHVDDQGVLYADIDGKELSSDLDLTVHVKFPLALKGYQKGPTDDVEEICSHAKDVRIDDGGNVQNMAINLLYVLADEQLRAFLQRGGYELKVTIASSSDPFAKVPPQTAQLFHGICSWHQLNLKDRFAIQAPWQDAGKKGTLAITSEPKRTGDALVALANGDAAFANACQSATCFVSSDPLYDHLGKVTQPPYTYLLNASSAFRTFAATESYAQSVLLPMNNDEAGEVSRVLLQRKLAEELSAIERPPFPSPFKPNGKDVDPDALAVLDRSTEMLATYIPLKRYVGRLGIASPITFGKEGGMVVGTGHEEVVCFTTTPHPDRELQLLEEFGDPTLVERTRLLEVGAGDSAATINMFFATVDPAIFLHPHLIGREREDRTLLDIATTMFVSVLSRIGGNFVVRNQQTNWSNIKTNAFLPLFQATAKGALAAARTMMLRYKSDQIAQGEIKRWGIQVLVWKLRSVAYPQHDALPPEQG